MKERLWKMFAWFVCLPAVTAWLEQRALDDPDTHIGDYMYRYWLIRYVYKIKVWATGLVLSIQLPVSARIHYINRPDADLYLHDHPWDWRTVILRGWYWEETSTGEKIIRMRGDTVGRDAFDPHRISKVAPHGVVTLFIMFKWRNRWGFYVGDPARKVYYRNYKSVNNRGEERPQTYVRPDPDPMLCHCGLPVVDFDRLLCAHHCAAILNK